jgi:DNA-binding NarL/FixJ family response regulator
MIDVTILAMTDDAKWLELFWSELRTLPGARLIVTESMEEACDLLHCAGARLIVIDWQADTVSYEQMDYLLWANTILRQPVPVLVVADGYQSDHALTLFRMGVDEYIGMSQDLYQLPTILSLLLARRPARPTRVGETAPEVPRPVHGPLPLPARWIAAASPA